MKVNQTCVCETCGKVFLNMDAYEYAEVHKLCDTVKAAKLEAIVRGEAKLEDFQQGDIQKYDKWFLEATRHWIENPTHTIIVSGPRCDVDMTREYKLSLQMLGESFLEAQRKLCELAWDEGSVI